jgi:cell division transport system ATP-binding protein
MSLSTNSIVSLVDTSIYQDNVLILHDLNFEINKGELVYLIGKTGSGKTSLLKTLYADLGAPKGKIMVAGYDISTIKKDKIPFLRRKIGIIFQDFQLLNDRSIAENLLFVLRATGWTDNTKMKARVSEILMRVGLDALTTKYPHQLSGGEQQRTVIARALLNDPEILIADEPTGNLDPEVADEIMKLFLQINRSGTAILMATHNHQFLERFPGRILKIQNGAMLDSASKLNLV